MTSHPYLPHALNQQHPWSNRLMPKMPFVVRCIGPKRIIPDNPIFIDKSYFVNKTETITVWQFWNYLLRKFIHNRAITN